MILGAFCGGLLAASWLMLPPGRMEVRLIMLGYSNAPWATLGYTNNLSWRVQPSGVYVAVLLATNTGSVPVRLHAGIRSEDFFDTNFAHHTPAGLPAVIRPGESLAVTVTPPLDSWRTALLYQRHVLWDRLYGKAWATGNPMVQQFMAGVLPPPKDGVARSGRITNTLRAALPLLHSEIALGRKVPVNRFYISAPPPLVPSDLIERLSSQDR
jgi:hypothetical protein